MDRPGAVVAIVVAAVVSSLLAVGGVVWLVVGHPGVDGAGPPPRSTTVADFCSEYGDPLAAVDGPDSDFATAWRDYGRRLEAVGLPAGAPPRVRRGFDLWVESMQRTPDGYDPISDAGTLPVPDATEDAAMLAFDRWASRRCGLPDPLD